MSFFPFFLFRQLCLYISDSLHLFTLFLTNSLEKCQTKSFENEYFTFCNTLNNSKCFKGFDEKEKFVKNVFIAKQGNKSAFRYHPKMIALLTAMLVKMRSVDFYHLQK